MIRLMILISSDLSRFKIVQRHSSGSMLTRHCIKTVTRFPVKKDQSRENIDFYFIHSIEIKTIMSKTNKSEYNH